MINVIEISGRRDKSPKQFQKWFEKARKEEGLDFYYGLESGVSMGIQYEGTCMI